MRRFSFFLLALLGSVSPAMASWSWWSWGMSPQQAVLASNGEFDADVGKVDTAFLGITVAMTLRFASGDIGLNEVEMRVVDATKCNAMEATLYATYGGHEGTGFGPGASSRSTQWIDSEAGNRLTLTKAQDGCRVLLVGYPNRRLAPTTN